jgi:hypothetical protein
LARRLKDKNAVIQLSSLMWAVAIFFAIIGLMRGWAKEIIATSGITLAAFLLFQFDSLIRSALFVQISRDQAFLVQAGIFLAVVFVGYRTQALSVRRTSNQDWQNSALGGLVGFINGYLIMGSLWYFLDINEYPLSPLVVAPTAGSPSDQARELLPMVLLSGGTGGTGDIMTIAVIVLFVIVLIVL